MTKRLNFQTVNACRNLVHFATVNTHWEQPS